MKKLLMATVVGILAATAPVNAHADGPGYSGTCRIATANDTTPGDVLGGQNVWNGEVNILVVATTPGDTIDSASCWIKVNGGTESPILDAVVAGPVGVGAGRATFTADLADTVSICTHVDTGSLPPSDVCEDLTVVPACPALVCAEGGLLEKVYELITYPGPIEPVLLDPIVCAQLVTAAPAVDALPTADVLYIDPATGDTFVGGTGPDSLFWDCAPYVAASP